MICENKAKWFCCEDISLIENYDIAISSPEVYDCHHRREITENKTREQLKAENLYYKRPACELIFMLHSEHTRLHLKGKKKTEEHNKKNSIAHLGKKNAFYGKHHNAETRERISEKNKKRTGWFHTEEAKMKMSKSKNKGNYRNIPLVKMAEKLSITEGFLSRIEKGTRTFSVSLYEKMRQYGYADSFLNKCVKVSDDRMIKEIKEND